MWAVREKERAEELRKQRESQNIITEEENEDEENIKPNLWERIYYNEKLRMFFFRLYYSKIFRGLIIIIAVSCIIPVFVIVFLDNTDPDFDDSHTCSVETGYQIPCGNQGTTYGKCNELKCCFNETGKSCFHKVRSYYQYTQNKDNNEENYYTPVRENTPFGVENVPVYININKEKNYKLAINLSTKKQENNKDMFANDEEYIVNTFEKNLGIEVFRKINNQKILSTTHGPIIISKMYWELSVDLNATHLFGMDFLHMPDNQTITKVLYKNPMDHSSIARFLSYSSGKFHGLDVVHEGPMEVTVTEAKLLVFKVFSGSHLTLKLTTGPKPVDVLRQFRESEIWKPVPYWALGVHICRDGDVSSIDNILTEFNKFQKENNFPYDSDCLHENLFSLSKNKNNPKIDAAVQEIKSKKKFLMSLAPQVLVDNTVGSNYKKAEEKKILYTKNNKIMTGKYLNKTVAFPDYSSEKTTQWFKEFYDAELKHLSPDGIILRNNWPLNDFYKMTNPLKFQYITNEIKAALSKTIPWDSQNSNLIQHIDAHNNYGLDYTNIVQSQTKSDFILSSTFTSESQHAVHLQNINVTWVNFKDMLKKTLSHSLFGGTLFSVPVCGDTKNFSKILNQGLCLRWYLTASTMPVFRISSDIPRRDPSAFKDVKYVQNIMIDAIKMRYAFLPFFYTVLSENLPLVRPMFFNFPDNNNTFPLDEQYMIGEHLLIAQPSLFPAPNMQVYLPETPGGWYEFWGGMKFPQTGWVVLPMVERDLVAFIIAGKIVPLHDGTRNSAEETQKQPIKLVIALVCTKKNGITTCSSKGTLYTQKSITVEFQADDKKLIITNAEICQTSSVPDFSISKLQIYYNDVKYYNVPADKSDYCVKKNANVILQFSQLL